MKQPENKKSLMYFLYIVVDHIYAKVGAAYTKLRSAYEKLYAFVEKVITLGYIRFSRINKTKIVFNSYLGRGYGDNPKYIAEEILRRNLGWDLVWEVSDTQTSLPEGVRPVQYNSMKALRERATAKVWIDNARHSVRPCKKKGQICIQTWHGGLNFKYVEAAVEKKLHPDYVRLAKEDGKNCDAIISGCKLRSEEYKKYFWLNEKTEILEVGLPRNDALFDREYVKQAAARVREELGISEDIKIVLYMPTFRDNDAMDAYINNFDMVLSAVEERFECPCVFLIRLHPNVQYQGKNLTFNDRIKNVTSYPDAQVLYMASDILISDYSSSVFDFALLQKPVFLYTADCDQYRELRGLNGNFDICPFPRSECMEELINNIKTYSVEEYMARMDSFYQIWKPFDKGQASAQVVDWIIKKMEI